VNHKSFRGTCLGRAFGGFALAYTANGGSMSSKKYAIKEVCRQGSMSSRKYVVKEVCRQGSMSSRKYVVKEVCRQGSILLTTPKGANTSLEANIQA
jgi:hypothetical protein